MEYEMNNGMLVEVTYFADQYDHKIIEIDSVTWRGVGIMHALTSDEMNELFGACYDHEYELMVGAAEAHYEMRADR